MIRHYGDGRKAGAEGRGRHQQVGGAFIMDLSMDLR